LLENKVCIITGAGKGIGREIAKTFYKQGAKLALITRSQEDINSLKFEFSLNNDRLLTYCGDVAEPDIVSNFVQEVVSKFGVIDVLVNNAGTRFRKKFLDITHEEFNKVVNTNVGSVFSFCQEIIPHMIESKQGKVINISSIAGTLGFSELSAYVTSKAAIIGLTKSLAIEFAEDNIQINALAPGFCKTSYFENFKKKTGLYEFTIDRTPMRRWGKSEEVADACLFLASDMSNFVTGEVINVDGGWSAW
jgi:NAD(P)-dependent dehydrogenase (short-subunit alcohol dehydrogenase family)